MISTLSLPARRQLLLAAASTAASSIALPEMAWAAQKLVIGQSLPLSGPLSSYGNAKLIGSQAYFAGVNEGNPSQRIEIVALDDKYDPQLTITHTEVLAEKYQAAALLGYFGVPTINAALPVLDQLKIPLVGLTSGSREIRKQFRPYAFPVRASYQTELEKIVSHMNTIGLQRIAVIAQENAFGDEVKTTLLEVASAAGIKDVSVFVIANNAANAVSVADKVAGAYQAVVLATLSAPAIAIVQALTTKRARKTLYGLSALDATQLYKSLGESATGIVQSQVIPSPNDTTKAISRLYVAALKKHAPSEVPSYFGLEGFIEATVLGEAIKRAGAAAGLQARSAIKTSLEKLNTINLGGFFVDYSASQRTGSRYVDLTILGSSGNTVR